MSAGRPAAWLMGALLVAALADKLVLRLYLNATSGRRVLDALSQLGIGPGGVPTEAVSLYPIMGQTSSR